ncbi:MAG: PAS domain S-box protein, partial [Desulfobacterales bacterium]|nr:PAS domain S-box protein [Desulfobacterales bacterium]
MAEKPSYEALLKRVEALEDSHALAADLSEKLDATTQKIKVLTDQNLMAVIEWDLDFRALEWNPAAEAIFGYTRDEALGRQGDFIIPESVLPHVRKVQEEIVTGKSSVRSVNENMTKSGNHILCDWFNSPLMDRNGEVIGIASLISDVTDRKKAEDNLLHSERRFQ